jgi:hypothetical protein
MDTGILLIHASTPRLDIHTYKINGFINSF